ncbi:MAG: tRNA (adenosine(37)-N6)-threonylcarbamoyltransferase complex dimerization subunit type 1 TsaB [Bacteroidales bacterium]|nr:tRNA (adenosine(37)-N6)-threonylcarbamoyltransferase complex dimerization subunit type 1 TsaB [Bacteroidales bacterium]
MLLIETSTATCSVSLAQRTHILAHRSTFKPRSHASLLAVFIDQILEECNITVKDCAAVAVSGGPGSYTGLRVGVSTAKGLCFGSGLPLIHVCSLQLIAQLYIDKHMKEVPQYIYPMIDARRMEVYTAPFIVCKEKDTDPIACKEGPVEAIVVQPNSFADSLEKGLVIFAGDGALKCKEVISHEHALFLDLESHANGMAKAAWEAYSNNRFEDLAYYVPFYLKKFQAKLPKKDV